MEWKESLLGGDLRSVDSHREEPTVRRFAPLQVWVQPNEHLGNSVGRGGCDVLAKGRWRRYRRPSKLDADGTVTCG